MFRSYWLFLRLTKESFLSALNSLILNKLRTVLTLLGITIGIFAIISVFTVIDALENAIKKSIESLGDKMVYVQKWPWSMGGDYPWWKYMNRPVPTFREMEEIQRRTQKAEAISFCLYSQRNVQYGENIAQNIAIGAFTSEYQYIRSFEIEKGRYFSPIEMSYGKNCAVIGFTIAEKLFEQIDPVGKTIKIDGKKILVIGVFKKEGSDFFGNSTDEEVHIPLNYIRTIVNLHDDRLDPFIMVKAKKQVSLDELVEELRGIMRSIRRLPPKEEDDFALNQTSLLSVGFKGLFQIIDIAGFIIGGFSIIVGGFGIANIMFVSVKEQTQIIGIEKALGAKNYFILFQFLSEAVMLSLMGGLIGLVFIFIGTLIVGMVSDMEISMTAGNVTFGLAISIITGIISGFIPARSASRLNPVEAINTI